MTACKGLETQPFTELVAAGGINARDAVGDGENHVFVTYTMHTLAVEPRLV